MESTLSLTPTPKLLEIPRTYCPLPVAIHPNVAELGVSLEAWEKRFNLLQTEREWLLFHAMQPHVAAALAFPHKRFDVLELAAQTVAWILQFDPIGCEGPANSGDFAQATANLAHVQQIVEDPERELNSQDPYLLALQDIWLRYRKVASNEQLYRLHLAWLRWAHGNACELGYRVNATMPSLPDYLVIRRSSCGSQVFVAHINIGREHPIPGDLWSSHEMRELLFLGDDHWGIDNDINGYLHDAQSPRQLRWNIVDVIAHEHRIPVEQAMQRAWVLHRDKMQRIADICRTFREGSDVGLREFAIDFEYVMSGPWEWYHRIDRYQVVEDFF
jgi:hypothetical protein